MSPRLQRLLPWVAGVAGWLALCVPVLDPAQQLFYRDTGRLYYPVKKYLAERLLQGQLPFWDPWTEAGVSVLGQLSPALLHPWTLLYLVFPFDLAFKLNHLLPLFVAGLGMFLLARRLGCSPPAALAGAFAYGGAGYLVSQAAANLIFVVGPAGMPLALERLLAFLEAPSRGRLLAAAALLALCGLGGDPQSMMFAGMFGGVWAVLRHGKRGALLAAAWCALALAFAAPAALPAVGSFRHSKRAAGLTAYERLRFFVPPQRWPGFLVSGAFDDSPEATANSAREIADWTPFPEYFGGGEDAAFSTSIYLGAPALLLAAFALRRGRRGPLALLGALFFLLAAGGDELGLSTLLFRVPGFSLFRYTEKMIAPFSMLVALAAALGAEEAVSSPRRRGQLCALSALLCALLLGAWAVAAHPPGAVSDWLAVHGALHSPSVAQTFLSQLKEPLLREAAFAATLALLGLAALLRPSFPALWLLPLACGAAALSGSGPQLSTIPVEHYQQAPPLARELRELGGPGPFRIYVFPRAGLAFPRAFDPKSASAQTDRLMMLPQLHQLYGFGAVGDYFTSVDPDYADICEQATAVLFPLLGVRFSVYSPSAIAHTRAQKLRFRRTLNGFWIQDVPAAPPALLFDEAAFADTPKEAAALLDQPGFDPWRTAILRPEAEAIGRALQRGPRQPPVPSLRRSSPERISVTAGPLTLSLLEVSEHFDPGWSARVDGRPVPVVQVDFATLGVPLPAGQHQVELEFFPPGLREGMWLALAGLALVLVTGLVSQVTKSVSSTPAYPFKSLRKFSLRVARPLLK